MDELRREGAGARSQVGIVLTAVFLAYLGQTTLNPVIAPLSRDIGLAEWQVGVTISVAASMVVLTSQFWGRRSQSWGSKSVLVAALSFCAVAMALFTVVAFLGLNGDLTGVALFVLFVLTRGLLFGAALAAVIPTAQAYVANVTSDEKSRVKGMAGVGAAQGVASIAGALVGGLFAGVSLMVSVGAVPVILLIGARTALSSSLTPSPSSPRTLGSGPFFWLVSACSRRSDSFR